MEKHKNILITGGAGFIGSNLALELIKSGHSVTVLDNLPLKFMVKIQKLIHHFIKVLKTK